MNEVKRNYAEAKALKEKLDAVFAAEAPECPDNADDETAVEAWAAAATSLEFELGCPDALHALWAAEDALIEWGMGVLDETFGPDDPAVKEVKDALPMMEYNLTVRAKLIDTLMRLAA